MCLNEEGLVCTSLRLGRHWSAFLSIFLKPVQVGSLRQGKTFWGCGGGGGGVQIRCHLNLSSLGLSAGRSLDGGGKHRGLRFL